MNEILNVSALVTDRFSSLKHADIPFNDLQKLFFISFNCFSWFFSIAGGIFIVVHVLELGSGAPKYHIDPKSMKIIEGCCLFNKGIMGDALVIIHNQEKVEAVLRKSSKKQVQNW